MKSLIADLVLSVALGLLLCGCYPGGLSRWKGIPERYPVPEHCKSVNNPCGEPWAYPPLHD